MASESLASWSGDQYFLPVLAAYADPSIATSLDRCGGWGLYLHLLSLADWKRGTVHYCRADLIDALNLTRSTYYRRLGALYGENASGVPFVFPLRSRVRGWTRLRLARWWHIQAARRRITGRRGNLRAVPPPAAEPPPPPGLPQPAIGDAALWGRAQAWLVDSYRLSGPNAALLASTRPLGWRGDVLVIAGDPAQWWRLQDAARVAVIRAGGACSAVSFEGDA